MKKVYNVGDVVTVKSAKQVKAEGDLINYGNGVHEDNTIAEIVNYEEFNSKASGLIEDCCKEQIYIIKFKTSYGDTNYRRIIQSHIIVPEEKIKDDLTYLNTFLNDININ